MLQLCHEDRLEAQAEEQPVEPTGRMKDFSREKEQNCLELFKETALSSSPGVLFVGLVFSPPLVFCFLWLQVGAHLWVTKLAERKQTQINYVTEATYNKEQSTSTSVQSKHSLVRAQTEQHNQSALTTIITTKGLFRTFESKVLKSSADE